MVALQNFQSKSTVVNPHLGNVDVVSMITEGQTAFVNYMMLNNGSIIYANTVEIEKRIEEEEDAAVLALAYARLRERYHSVSGEVISAVSIDLPEDRLLLTIPKAGDKKKLLDMSLKNAEVFRQEMRKKKALMLETSTPDKEMQTLEELQTALQLPELPVHIECFDNSNFQGSYPVAAMVCFVNGVASKKDYRHFKIRTVEGIDDFASMSEIVYRRYKRLLEEEKSLPQLVIIDGVRGQLGAALKSIKGVRSDQSDDGGWPG